MEPSASARTAALPTRKRARPNSEDSGDPIDLVDSEEDATMKAGSGGEASASARPPQRDDEFWFEDGTVILIARDVEFRIYKGILTSQSTVFRELLSKSPPTRIGFISFAYCVRCPVLNVSDTPEDLRHVLRVYTPHRGTTMYATKKPGFAEISACLRLAKKYQFAHLYDQALQFLKGHYTDDFSTWGKLTRWAPEGWADAEAIGVVNLARTVGEPSLLPTALLACAALRKGIAKGFTRADGQQETLSPADLDICFHGAKTEVRKASLAVLFRTLAYNPKCIEARSCRIELRKVVKGLHDHVDRIIGEDPFCSHLNLLDNKLEVCDVCEDALDALNKEERFKMWCRLPEMLGIEVPGWPAAVLAQENAPAS